MIADVTQCAHLIEQDACADCRPRPVPALRVHGDPALYGSWFLAAYDGECDGCGGEIMADDRIRADGQDGWICEGCGEDDPGEISAYGNGLDVHQDPGRLPTIAEFMSGAGGPGFSDNWSL
jgi:hypothetical protein